MAKVKAFYRLARPFNALTGALAVFLGGYVASTGEWTNVLIASFVVLLITASSNAWNDYLDVEIDRINQPHRVLPSGQLSPRAALIFAIVLAFLSMLLAAFVNWPAFFIALFSNFLLTVYSWRLKSTVLLGNAAVATVSGASIIFGGVAAGNVGPTYVLFLITWAVIFGREILKTMADYEGDLHEHVRTVATVWGKKWSGTIFGGVIFVIAALLMLPYIVNNYSIGYVLITVLGVYPVIFYALFKVKETTPAQQLEKMSQIIKYDFLVWFVAVLVGAGTW